MLDGGDKSGRFPFEERDGVLQHGNIEADFPRQEDDPLLLIDRRVSEMDEHVGRCQGVERKVTGTVTGIPADDHVEPRVPEEAGTQGCPAFQPGRELEGDFLCPALPQLPDKIRGIV